MIKKCFQKNQKNQRNTGLTLFEVVMYLALASVFMSVALPTSLNIFSATQSELHRSEYDQQFITFIHSIEGLVRTGQATEVSGLVARYGDLISSSSVSTEIDSQTGQRTLFVSFFYQNQIYSYVYAY